MRFPDFFLEELKTRLSMSGVVGRYIAVKKAGKEYHALCPFHHEKSPSFTVNDQKEFYHCFGCGAHGSIFDFVMNYEKVTFPEAVEKLASMAGVPLPEVSPDARLHQEKRQTLIDVMEAAAQFFEDALHRDSGRRAKEYVQGRGLSPDTMREFRLGWSPDRPQELQNALRKKDMTLAQMIAAGLVVQPPESDRAPYDRFRGRVMFPINNMKGRVVAFGGRILDSRNDVAKYLNSPETELFHKGQMLFNLDRVRRLKKADEPVIVVEGYMDVIGLYDKGIANVVAPLGTALTEEQAALLWQYTDVIVLCFDGDNAGQAAAARALDRLLPVLKAGKEVRFMTLPAGDDPDSFVLRHGAGEFHALVRGAIPLSQKIYERETIFRQFKSAEDRARLLVRLKDTADKIKDYTLRRATWDSLRQKAYADFSGNTGSSTGRVKTGRSGHSGGSGGSRAQQTGLLTSPQPDQQVARALMVALVQHPLLLPEVLEDLGLMHLPDPLMDDVRATLFDLGMEGEQGQTIADRLRARGFDAVIAPSPVHALMALFPALRSDTLLAEVRGWWMDAAAVFRDRERDTSGVRLPDAPMPDLDLEEWWKTTEASLRDKLGTG